MGFTPIIFLCAFFPMIIAIMSIFTHYHNIKARNILLLGISIVIYAFSGLYSLIAVAILATMSYLFSKKVAGNKTWLAFSVIVCVVALLVFKYSNFLVSNTVSVFSLIGIHLDIKIQEIIMPAGISFITFSIISFLVDTYRNPQLKKVSIFDYITYIFMFPKILEGPIASYDEIQEGLSASVLSARRIYEGIQRFMIGFSKKVILADTLVAFVEKVFDGNLHASGYAWLGLISYALQLYFDFSGYTDMAIGLGKICGFDLPENFKDPYLAMGIQDFWRRWHITLSVWFKKYIYFPLGGNREGKVKTYRNLLIIFMLTGIWHGANWTFLVWGLWHGLFMLIERVGFSKILKKLPSFFVHVYTLFIILIGWVLFRSESFTNALIYLRSMFGNGSYADANIIPMLNMHMLFILFIGILISFRVPEKVFGRVNEHIPIYIKDVCLIIIFILAITYMVSNGFSPSIYTKF